MNKTIPTDNDVADFLATLSDETQHRDSEVLIKMMHKISGEPPVMWGSSIIGFGKRHYKYASGREGDWMKIGFSPRKGKISLYITGDANKYVPELDAMGKYEIGKGCIYIKQLVDVDIEKLEAIINKAYQAGDYC